MVTLDHSYKFCRDVARKRAKNFYYSFVLLPKKQRAAMCAIYAFMRYCDDLSDEPGASREAMDQWRGALRAALAGDCSGHPALPAFSDTVKRYGIPHRLFEDMIDGMTSDLEPRRIETFEELYHYCYQVAGVVGLTIIHIFGFEDQRALGLAEKCGVAFQLTNIIRDVQEDRDRGRVYIPLEDLRRFGVPEISPTPAFVEMLRFQGSRARQFYVESAPLVAMVKRESQASLRALITIYSELLRKIEASDYDVLARRIRLSTLEKVRIIAASL